MNTSYRFLVNLIRVHVSRKRLILPFLEQTCVAAYCKIAAHSAYDMFSKYEYLNVNLFFPNSIFFLIAPFPDHCLPVPLSER